MYLAAGQVTARVSGKSWDDFTRERILVPLGMTATNTSTKALAGQPDVATPHAEIDSVVRPVPWRNIDNIAPAGAINSNAVDMAQWVRLQLGRGRFEGKQLVSARQMDEMHTPHTLIRTDSAARAMNPATHIRAYGLGWFLEDYQGRLVVHHGGNIDGMSALVAMLPEERLGVVILTNMNGSPFPAVVSRRLWDLHLKTPRAKDWSAEMRRTADSAAARARAAQQRLESQRVANTRPSLPLDQYAGVYADSMYGEVRVRADANTLRIDRGPSFQGELEHWHFDTFRSMWAAEMLGRSFVTFRLNAAGKVDDLVMDMGGQAVAFKKRAEPASPRAAASGTGR
jgi:CubicO group peptidase (beta-lactamase class C family)